MGPHQLAGVEPRVEVRVGGAIKPLGERPLRPGVVLGLDREQAPDRRTGGPEGRAREPLRDEPSPRDRLDCSDPRQR
jgi:hypothetical protein